jgi:hypothetical protein
MKKLLMLAGIAAAAWGAMRLFRGKNEDEFQLDDYTPSQPSQPATDPQI